MLIAPSGVPIWNRLLTTYVGLMSVRSKLTGEEFVPSAGLVTITNDGSLAASDVMLKVPVKLIALAGTANVANTTAAPANAHARPHLKVMGKPPYLILTPRWYR